MQFSSIYINPFLDDCKAVPLSFLHSTHAYTDSTTYQFLLWLTPAVPVRKIEKNS